MTYTSAFLPRDPARCVHFVGFRGDEYWSAAKVFGRPHTIHRRWDLRARREVGEDDLVVFAKGDERQEPATQSGDDLDERYLL